MSKIIGLDLGTVTLGIAITDENAQFVFGREVFRFKPGNYYLARTYLLDLVEKEKIERVVIGLPYNMDGTIGERGQSVMRFVEDLKKSKPDLIVDFQDERLSTVEAHERLALLGYNAKKQKDKVDMVAAQVILETYLKRGNKQ